MDKDAWLAVVHGFTKSWTRLSDWNEVKNTAYGDCSHKIKIDPWKKSYDQPRQHIKKQRHYFANKGLSSQRSGFSSSHIWMCELDYKESWASKNCHQAFELWFWRRLLRIPWTARRSNQFILKEINPEYTLEGMMLKLKLQYLSHLMRRTDSFVKTLMLEKIEGKRRGDNRGWGGWMASLTQWTWVWVNSGSWWWTGTLGVLQSMGSQRVRHDWTELNWTYRDNTFSSCWPGQTISFA